MPPQQGHFALPQGLPRLTFAEVAQLDLNADQLGPLVASVLLEPVRIDQARPVIVGGFTDGTQERLVHQTPHPDAVSAAPGAGWRSTAPAPAASPPLH